MLKLKPNHQQHSLLLKKLVALASHAQPDSTTILPGAAGYPIWQLDCSPSELAIAFDLPLDDFQGRKALEDQIATLTALRLISDETTETLDCGPAIQASKCYDDAAGTDWIGYRFEISCLLANIDWQEEG